MDTRYRSYVIRVWSRDGERATASRALIEEVQSGRQVEVRDAEAARLAASIEHAMGASAVGIPIRIEASGGQEGSPMILVVGATGTLGGQIARGLLDDGRAVRILVRPTSDYRELEARGCEPVIGDLKDRASLDAACRGVDTIVTTAISLGRGLDDTVETVELGGYASLIEAAVGAGVRQFVYTSVLNAYVGHPNPFFAAKAVTEQRLRESGLAWTILAPNAFMDVWVGAVVAGPALSGRDIVLVGSGLHRHAFVLSQDVAAFARATIGRPEARSRYLPVGGPAAITYGDAIEAFEQALGHELPYRSVAPGQEVPGLDPMMAGLLAFQDTYDSDFDTRELADEFGVHLTSVAEWARSMVPALVG